jgi:hypothetical protein
MSKHGILITVADDQEGANPQIVTPDNPLPIAAYDANGNPIEVDTLGHLGVVTHSHDEGGYVLFEREISTTQDFIFIDLSDTTDYPHSNTSWIHVGNLIIDVDATNTADYEIHMGFIDNVDGADGDFHHVYSWKGSKLAGRQIHSVIATSPESVKMRTSSTLGTIDLNQTAFQTDVNLASTKDPLTIDTPSGDGDVVLRVIVNTGSINLSLSMTYHSHSEA